MPLQFIAAAFFIKKRHKNLLFCFFLKIIKKTFKKVCKFKIK